MKITPLFVGLLLVAMTDVASAKPATDWRTRKAKPERRVSPETTDNAEAELPDSGSYSLALGLGYAVPPVLFGSLVYISATNDTDDLTAPLIYAGLISMFVVPAGVHVAYRNGPGAARAAFASLASTALLGFLGGTVFSGASDCSGSDDGLCNGLNFAGGAVLGGTLGYASWAIIDTAFLAHRPVADAPPPSGLQLTPTIAPIVTRTAASHTPTLHGVSFGLMGQF